MGNNEITNMGRGDRGGRNGQSGWTLEFESPTGEGRQMNEHCGA